ncbi:hypothetical protein FACS189499_05930 [Clostridia bacterium]|nr:hypothetical protein FACS189499_05930 [Clostridia bacterium]
MLSIDININRLRLVHGKQNGEKVNIHSADSRELPEGSVEDGRIVDAAAVAGEIGDIIIKNKIRERKVICGISSSAIIYKELTIPEPRIKEDWNSLIENMISANLGLSFNYKVTYVILGRDKGEDGQYTLRLAATACPIDIIDGYKALFKLAGLKLVRVVVANNSMSRLILRNQQYYSDVMPLLIVQVSTKFINVNVYDEGELKFSRFTNIDPSDYDEGADYVNLAVFDNLFHIIHFFQQSQGTIDEPKHIKAIRYYGSVSDSTGLEQAIDQFGVDVGPFTRPRSISVNFSVDFLYYANLFGALYDIDRKTEDINFLDTIEARAHRENKAFGWVAGVVAAISLFVVIASFVALSIILGTHETTLAETEERLAVMNYDSIMAEKTQKENAINVFTTYLEKIELSRALFDFQPRMVRDVVDKLESVMIPNKVEFAGPLGVQGYTISATFTTEKPEVPTKFIQELEAQGYFEGINYTGYEAAGVQIVTDPETGEETQVDGGGYTFSITMRLKGGNALEVK